MNKIEKFKEYVKNNDLKNLKFLIEEEDFDPSYLDNWAFEFSVFKSYSDIVEYLIKDERIDTTNQNCFAFFTALKNNDEKTLAVLLKDKKIKEYLKKTDINLYKTLNITNF